MTLGPTSFPNVASAVAIRVSRGIAGLARARPMRSSATTAAAVSSSLRQASTASSRTATSKAASA